MPGYPEVSVLLPAHNAERFIAEALESILSQTFSNWEIIAIDDGSSDRTGEILDEYKARDSRVRVVHRRHSGLVESLNGGLSLASGELIARQDADDISLPNRLQLQVDFLKYHPNVVLVGGAFKYLWSGPPFQVQFPLDNNSIQVALLSKTGISHPTVMYRASSVRLVGGYRKQFVHAEDYDLWLRLGEHFELANMADTLIFYRIHDTQIGHQHIRQQSLSGIAAKLCAERRRQHGTDIADGIDLVTEEFLERCGVPNQEIIAQIVVDLLNRATACLKNADANAASKLIEAALREKGIDMIGRQLLGKVYFAKGKVTIRSGRTARGVWWLVRSLFLNPRPLFDAIRQRVRNVSCGKRGVEL